ncbi:hypothetical protein VB735_23355 [Halotia wernerae UHCC 0503]|nr:hypothetical protein [Halotia wernerae UHCC 0503]
MVQKITVHYQALARNDYCQLVGFLEYFPVFVCIRKGFIADFREFVNG